VSQPITPEPDVKDWTWAVTDPCPECGFEPAAVERARIPDLVHRYTAPVQAAVLRPDAAVRPRPAVWSALEYGCHVRDVCRIFRERVALMRAENDPQFDNWDQDRTALAERYWAQRPHLVAAQLAEQADSLADEFAGIRPDEWHRPGRRSNGSVFTIDTIGRYLLHDLAHHAWDVRDS
jgi:DinB family protein